MTKLSEHSVMDHASPQRFPARVAIVNDRVGVFPWSKKGDDSIAGGGFGEEESLKPGMSP